MAHWRVVDLLNHSGEVESKRGRLIVSGVDVPLEDVTAIIIGAGTHLSGSVNLLASQFGVPILTCDWRGMPLACTFPWSENTRVGARHRAQMNLSIPRQKNAWMRIVKAKIRGQRNNLSLLTSRSLTGFDIYIANVRSGDPDNIEARAARSYWPILNQGEAFSRDPGAGFGLNSLLDYGYAILRSTTVRYICEAGLSPAFGIWHRNRSNPFGLADDLIEPFRPAIDFMAITAGANATLEQREVKYHLVSVLTQPMAAEGETVATSIRNLARDYAIYAEGDSRTLEVPVWVPPSG